MAEVGHAWTMLLAALGAPANHLHSIDALVDSIVSGGPRLARVCCAVLYAH